MTYIYYIRKNNMRDSKDAYTSYLKEHDSSTKSMTAPMLENSTSMQRTGLDS